PSRKVLVQSPRSQVPDEELPSSRFRKTQNQSHRPIRRPFPIPGIFGLGHPTCRETTLVSLANLLWLTKTQNISTIFPGQKIPHNHETEQKAGWARRSGKLMRHHFVSAVASLLIELPNDSAGNMEVKAEPKCMPGRTIKHKQSTCHSWLHEPIMAVGLPCSCGCGPMAGISPCRSALRGLRYRPPDRDVAEAARVPSSAKENCAMPGSRMDRAARDGDAHGSSLEFSQEHIRPPPSASIRNSRTLSGAMVPLFVLGMICVVRGQEEQSRQPPVRLPAQVAEETFPLEPAPRLPNADNAASRTGDETKTRKTESPSSTSAVRVRIPGSPGASKAAQEEG